MSSMHQRVPLTPLHRGGPSTTLCTALLLALRGLSCATGTRAAGGLTFIKGDPVAVPSKTGPMIIEFWASWYAHTPCWNALWLMESKCFIAAVLCRPGSTPASARRAASPLDQSPACARSAAGVDPAAWPSPISAPCRWVWCQPACTSSYQPFALLPLHARVSKVHSAVLAPVGAAQRACSSASPALGQVEEALPHSQCRPSTKTGACGWWGCAWRTTRRRPGGGLGCCCRRLEGSHACQLPWRLGMPLLVHGWLCACNLPATCLELPSPLHLPPSSP